MYYTHRPSYLAVLCFMALLTTGLAACKEKGPVEQIGEEVDEAVDTAKRGEESPATKADDAVDDLRKGAKDAAHELKDK
jgi:hypothetical protein